VECPACPHPDRNLPLGWIDAPDNRRYAYLDAITYASARLSNYSTNSRWLYSLTLAIDANFRLKNKARGIENDPPLGDGWGHWVPNKPYQEHIGKHGYQKEVCRYV
jgi:hypothetical protein